MEHEARRWGNDFSRSLWGRTCVAFRWRFSASGRPHALPAKLVVSLTSYPPRFGTLAHTLRSLLRQTVKADHTILWIAHSDFSRLPKNVTDLQARGLEIRSTDDLRSYKKILPALDAFPGAFICTADDDIYYQPSWLEELVGGADPTGPIVPCHRAHEITFDPEGKFRPIKEWVLDTPHRGTGNALFPTSGAGVLYPPGILAHTAEDRDAISKVCPDADQIWLYWIGRRNNALYKTVGRRRELLTWYGSQTHALWRSNVLQGGDEEQLRKMVKRYGYP